MTVVDEGMPEPLPVKVAVFPQIVPEYVSPYAVALTEFPVWVYKASYGVGSYGLPQVLFEPVRVTHHVPVASTVGAAQAGESAPPPPLQPKIIPSESIKIRKTILCINTSEIYFPGFLSEHRSLHR
jgi:hypothetical protein